MEQEETRRDTKELKEHGPSPAFMGEKSTRLSCDLQGGGRGRGKSHVLCLPEFFSLQNARHGQTTKSEEAKRALYGNFKEEEEEEEEEVKEKGEYEEET